MHINIPIKYRKLLKPIDDIKYYFVGGFVRDILLGRTPRDIDIVVFDDISTIEDRLSQRAFIVNERFNTARFMIKGTVIDINRADNLHSDIKRRDFTVNALCADMDGNILDYTGGMNDLRKGILRPVGKASFSSDPVRILRAYRFRHELNMTFARGTNPMISQAASKIVKTAPERILQEMYALFSQPDTGYILYDLYRHDILISLFPELSQTRHYYHKKCGTRKLIFHLLKTVKCIDTVLNAVKCKSIQLYSAGHMFELYMSALFHDIAKPHLEKKTNKGLSFAGHDIESSKTASSLLKSHLKISNDSVGRINRIIRMHMRPHMLVESEKVTRRGFFRLLRDAGDDLPGLIVMAMADKLASDCIMDNRYIKLYNNVLNVQKAIEEKSINIINGNEIMHAFGLKPSPLIGRMLEAGNEFAVQNSIKDKKLIINFLKKKFNINAQ